MANIDGAGSFTLAPLWFQAEAVAAQFAAIQTDPPDGTRPPSLGIPLTIMVSSSTLTHTDVQVQVDDTADFSSPVYDLVLTDRANVPVSVTPGGLVNKTTYYWRVRAAQTGTTGWSAWSTVWTYTPDLDSGKAFAYVNENMGASPVPDPDAVGQNVVNVGVFDTPSGTAFRYEDENIGVEWTPDGDGFGYSHYGDASTNTPTPHLWWLRPASGRAGDGVEIVCFGVGDLASTYGGVVEAYYGAGRGWVAIPTTGWQTYPETVNAYTPARELDEAGNIIDMQHTVVAVTVPLDALPPGLPLRIRTEGP